MAKLAHIVCGRLSLIPLAIQQYQRIKQDLWGSQYAQLVSTNITTAGSPVYHSFKSYYSGRWSDVALSYDNNGSILL